MWNFSNMPTLALTSVVVNLVFQTFWRIKMFVCQKGWKVHGPVSPLIFYHPLQLVSILVVCPSQQSLGSLP